MELKHDILPNDFIAFILLIVPHGIETICTRVNKYHIILLLIVPHGIETLYQSGIVCSLALF